MNLKYYYNLAKSDLFPICRSITGNGIQKSLKIIKKEFPKLKILKKKSGSKVYDWKIPPEWIIRDAYVKDKNDKVIIDFKIHNLHVVNFSKPIKKRIQFKYLKRKLYFNRDLPNSIPYVTSYYKKDWGFCISYNHYKRLIKSYKPSDFFFININSNFKYSGNLVLGEYFLKGKNKKEILISTYLCHPSMANNELSGPIVSMALINYFSNFKKLDKSIRFIFVPETIGSISYISKNISKLKRNVLGGFNLSCIGDERKHSCMLTKYENTASDEAIIQAYKKLKIKNFKIYSFLERGSDERQYNSPGIELPIASIFRSKYGTYPEYHSSLDDFNLVTPKGVKGGFDVAKEAIKFLLKNKYPTSKILCEPNLGKRGLYPTLSHKKKISNTISGRKYLDFLQYSDGNNSLNKIFRLISVDNIRGNKIYKKLIKNKILSSNS